MTIQEIATPAAVGFRWTSPDDVQHEVTWLRNVERDGGGWWFGTFAGGRWITTSAPGIPTCRTLKEARKVAADFVNAGE